MHPIQQVNHLHSNYSLGTKLRIWCLNYLNLVSYINRFQLYLFRAPQEGQVTKILFCRELRMICLKPTLKK